VNNLPKVECEAPRPGIEPATSRLQVRRPNHYATTPHSTTSALNYLERLCVQNDVLFIEWDMKRYALAHRNEDMSPVLALEIKHVASGNRFYYFLKNFAFSELAFS